MISSGGVSQQLQIGKSILFGITCRYGALFGVAVLMLSLAADDATPFSASKTMRAFCGLFGFLFGIGVVVVGWKDVNKHLTFADRELERHAAITAQMLPQIIPQPSPLEITNHFDAGEGLGSTRTRTFTALDPVPAKDWLEYICIEHGKSGRLPPEKGDIVAANKWGAGRINRWYEVIQEDGFTEWVGDGPKTGRRLKLGMGQGDLQRYYGHWQPPVPDDLDVAIS